jgi:hypothetical protein
MKQIAGVLGTVLAARRIGRSIRALMPKLTHDLMARTMSCDSLSGTLSLLLLLLLLLMMMIMMILIVDTISILHGYLCSRRAPVGTFIRMLGAPTTFSTTREHEWFLIRVPCALHLLAVPTAMSGCLLALLQTRDARSDPAVVWPASTSACASFQGADAPAPVRLL